MLKALQLVLALAILVIIHEFGHFLFARVFGIRNEKFYMFFNPWLSLVKWKPGKHVGFLGKTRFLSERGREEYEVNANLEKASDRYNKAEQKLKTLQNPEMTVIDRLTGKPHPSPSEAELEEARAARDEADTRYKEAQAAKLLSDEREHEESKHQSGWKRFWTHTEYGLGWLPLGGYCKISGMIDESMDTEQMKHPAREWEFRSKPAWQRLLVMIAGVLFNFLLAIVIYAGLVYVQGESYVALPNATMGMDYSGEARKIGFHNGDVPLAADGQALRNPMEARMKMAQAKEVTVLRGSDTVSIGIPSDFMIALDKEARSDTARIAFMSYRMPVRITQVMPGEGAAKAGIRPGDEIVAVDSVPTATLREFLDALPAYASETIDVKVARTSGERTDTLVLKTTLSEGAKMGVGLETDPSQFFKADRKSYNLLQAVPRGIRIGTDRLVSYAASMKMVFTKEGAKSIGGFGTLGSIFPEKWDWVAFWNVAAFLSVALAFMNILPIPALDGGHVLFLLYEMVMRRAPSQRFMEHAQMAGILLLIGLLLYANGMDIVRLFIK